MLSCPQTGTPTPYGPADLHVILANPRGFCAGVHRAIDAVVEALDRFGPPVYVRRAIVHNMSVVRSLEAQGAVFVEDLDEVPFGAVAVLSAHGVAPGIQDQARRRKLRVFDAVCPLVAKVHREVARHHRNGRHVILVGHSDHPEVEGTLGHLPRGNASVVKRPIDVEMLTIARDTPVAYAVQTTFSVDDAALVIDALSARFEDVASPPHDDICYATTNRQRAVRALASRVDAMLIAGEHFSSNASRLAEVAKAAGCPHVQLVPAASAIDWAPLAAARTLGISAAASTPEGVVKTIVDALGTRYRTAVEEMPAPAETVTFKPVAFA